VVKVPHGQKANASPTMQVILTTLAITIFTAHNDDALPPGLHLL
jgi:hypothetical protein